MTSLARAIQNLAEENGATFRLNSPVARINTRDGRVSGVTLESGEQLLGDTVVFNGDRSALATGLLGPDVTGATHATATESRGLSAVTWCLRTDCAGFPLSYHNVFFDRDYPGEFDALFNAGEVPERPTVYVCAQDRLGSGHGEVPNNFWCWSMPAGSVGIEPGANGGNYPPRRGCDGRLRASILTSATRRTANTAEFAARFPGSGGSLYGQATHGLLASFNPGRGRRCRTLPRRRHRASRPGVPMATQGRSAQTILSESRASRGSTTVVPDRAKSVRASRVSSGAHWGKPRVGVMRRSEMAG